MEGQPSLADERAMPAAKRTKTTRTEMLKRVAADEQEIQERLQKSDGRLYFDYSSPSVRKRREVARQIWEEFVEAKQGKTNLTQNQLYSIETCCDYTWEIIMTMGKHTQGRIGERAKAGTLYQFKEAIYWWLVRAIPNFSTIFLKWHTLAVAGIQQAALDYGLNKEWLPKHDLSELELDLLWNHVEQNGNDNLKQHYIAWVMVFMLSTRPGSLTVCPGYQKGAVLPNGNIRPDDETLRWSDLEFINLGDGSVCVRIVFRYNKGTRGATGSRQSEGVRRFRLMPLQSDKYHLDLALLLISLAVSRGLFGCSVEELFDGTARIIPQIPAISSQAVLVAGTQSVGVIVPTEAMRERALNPMLQEVCTAVGLLQRNTMYSLRRTAIIETRRKHSTETAQELAGHVPFGQAIFSYDHQPLADLDITNDRLDLMTYSSAEMRRMFSQANTARYVQDGQPDSGDARSTSETAENLKELIRKQATERARLNGEFLRDTNAIDDHRSTIREHLTAAPYSIDIDDLRLDTDLEDALKTHQGQDNECGTMLTTLHNLRRDNKNLLRRLQRKFVSVVKQEYLKKAQEDLKVFKAKGGTGGNLLGTKGSVLGPERDLLGDRAADQSAVASAEARLDMVQRLAAEDGDEPADATQTLDADNDNEAEEAADHGRSEPPQWQQLQAADDDIEVEPHVDGGSTVPTLEGRIAFVDKFASLQTLPTSNLQCLLCQLDDTIDYETKSKSWTKWKLKRHLAGPAHKREEQLKRAFRIDMDVDECADCIICDESIKGADNFIEHCNEEHPEQLEF